MLVSLRRSILVSIVFFLLLGLAYPLAETGIAQAFFSHQANGSLGHYGSSLVGQSWSGPRWFQGRPDAENPMATGGTNLGPRSEVLLKDVKQQIAKLRSEGIPATSDLLTTSGSGVDPDISPHSALVQVPAVARANGISDSVLSRLVKRHVVGRELGFLGAPYVNVLALNEALAALKR